MLHWSDFPVGSYIADHNLNTLWEKMSVGDWRHRNGTSHNVPEGEVTPDDVIPAHGFCKKCGEYPARRHDRFCCEDCKYEYNSFNEEEDDDEEWPDSEDNIVEDEALSTLVEE